MGWAPIYIRGRKGFEEAVVAKLRTTWLRGSTDGEINLLMFWLPKINGLRGFKKAIGSDLIFKYRMHFIADLDIHLNRVNKRSAAFSDAENEQIKNMTRLDTLKRDSTALHYVLKEQPLKK